MVVVAVSFTDVVMGIVYCIVCNCTVAVGVKCLRCNVRLAGVAIIVFVKILSQFLTSDVLSFSDSCYHPTGIVQ